MSTNPYPVNLDLAGRPALVVGGGPVAARKVAGLLAAGAHVSVVGQYRSRYWSFTKIARFVRRNSFEKNN